MDYSYLWFKKKVFQLATFFRHSSILKHLHSWPLKFVLLKMNIFHQTIPPLLTELMYHSHQTNYRWSLLLLVRFHLPPFEILKALQSFHQNEFKFVFGLQTQICNLGFIHNLFYWLDSYYFRLEFHPYGQCQKHHLIIIPSFLVFFILNLFGHWNFLAMFFQLHHINFL
jgi:hypothetical protein